MPSDTEGGEPQHVVPSDPQPPTSEPKWKRLFGKMCDWVRARLGYDESDAPVQAALLPAKPHVHRPGDPPETDEPKLVGPRLGTDPQRDDEPPAPTLAGVLTPQPRPGHPPFGLGHGPTGPAAHVAQPGDPPPTDEPKLQNPVPAQPPKVPESN